MKIKTSLKLFFFLSIFTFTILFPVTVKSESALYDQWPMKKEITINNQNNSNNLHNYQLLLNISYEPEMQDGFEDIRFSYYNSSSGKEIEIPYFIEKYENTMYADMWIKIPEIIAFENVTIFLYYGNKHANSSSNANNVFIYFEDWNYSGISDQSFTNNYNYWYQNGGFADIDNNHLKLTTISVDWCIALISSKVKYGLNKIIDINLNYHCSGAYCNEAFIAMAGFGNQNDPNFWYFNNNGSQIGQWWNLKSLNNLNGSSGNFEYSSETLFPNSFEIYSIARLNDSSKLYKNYQFDISNNISYFRGNASVAFGKQGNWQVPGSIYIDWYRIREFNEPIPNYTISPSQPNIQYPAPTNGSLIITNDDWRNVLASVSTGVPVLVAEGINDNVRDYIEDFDPDYIYTMGFDSGLNNSFQIDYDQVDSIFFPEVEKAVMVSDQERGIMASQLAYYEGIPLIFDSDHSSHFSEVLDLSNFSLEGIQDLYLDGVVEDGGNIDYLIITNPDFNESLLAGYLSGIRRGFVILTDNRTFESINRSINDAIDRLSGMGLFSSNLNYIKGDPLYLAILGGNDSIPFVPFFDMSLELFNDKDGFLIHSDVWYADVDGDGLFELAPGRIAGDIGSVSLQLSGLVLPRRGNAALIGEYRHNMFVDLLLFYGGMPQAFTGDLILKNAGIETERIVEERIKMPEFSAYSIIRNMMISVGEDAILYLVMGKFAAVVQTFERVTTIFYTLFEFDILEWVSGGSGYLPDHLPVIGEGLNGMIGETEILGYFGLGEDYWVIPPANRSKWDLILWPYRDSTELTVINHSRFLYADHDMSSGSAITRGVLERGGSALASSGIIHDPYSLHSSVCFIEDISSGKSVGSSLLDTLNFNALDYALTKVSLNPMDKYGDGVYWKNKLERILFSDPAYRPVERAFQEEAYEYEIMPSGSFLIESEITGDYIIENRALFFRNVDSYLTKQGKPIIPVFSREFILPRGSSIKSVDFDGTYSNKWMIKKEFVYNDSHYTNYSALVLGCIDDLGLVVGQELTVHQERRLAGCIKARAEQGIEYPFPEKNYWYRSNELLDGRVLVTVIVPGVLHRDRSVTEVLERGRVTIDYETPYEMSVDVNDTVLGENVSIVIHLYNEGSPLNGTLFVWIQNASASFTENVLVPEGGTVRSFEFCPGSKGIYKVVAVFSSDIPIGPRAKGFKVGKLDIEVNKEFKPNPIRKWRLRFSPKLPNKPRVTIKNLGGTRIKSVMIDDEIPEGFRINNWGRWIPLFVYLKREGGKWRFDMLGRDDYDYRIENGHLIVKIPDMEETISGECLEKGDELMIDYIMSMASVPETQDIKTKVKVATPNGMSLEKEITEELKVV